MSSFIQLYGLDRGEDRQVMRFSLSATEVSSGLEPRCVLCGREGAPIAVYGHTPVVIIAGSATPTPPNIVFCDWCAQDHHLGPGVALAEDLVNAWRTARGLPARDFSRR